MSGNLAFTSEEIKALATKGGLLALEIKCDSLSDMDEICDIILQAQTLGARKIILFSEHSISSQNSTLLTDFINAHDMHAAVENNPESTDSQRHQYACLINSIGDVMPCAGIPIPVGNIRKNALNEIIRESEVIQDLRNAQQMIKDPCGSCDELEHCAGRRGLAYQQTGDYLASDPTCERNSERQSEIIHLPVPVDQLIPQHPPLRLIDELVAIGERRGTVRMRVPEESPFLDAAGCLDEVTFFEMVAQATAAYEGFRTNRFKDQRIEGFLLGARNFEILGQAHVGDILIITACKEAEFGDFTIVWGEIHCDEKILARGNIKLWHN